MNLHDLPKDMLVKLVSTIEEETKKKYEDEIRKLRIRESLCNKFLQETGFHIEKCSFPKCESLWINQGIWNKINPIYEECKDYNVCIGCK